MNDQLKQATLIFMVPVHGKFGPDPAENDNKGTQAQHQSQKIDEGTTVVLDHDPQDHFELREVHAMVFSQNSKTCAIQGNILI